MKAIKHINHYKGFFVLCMIVTFFSCRPARFIQKEDQKLLNKLEIEISDKEKNIEDDQIASLIRQKPNRRILNFFRFHLWIYNLTQKRLLSKKESKGAKRKVNEIIGEAPVVYDSLSSLESIDQIKLYLQKKGYYNSQVELEKHEHPVNHKKLDLKYVIELGTPKLIDKVNYQYSQEEFDSLLIQKQQQNKLEGEVFDINLLKEEQERIFKTLKRNGFYHFNKQYVKVLADTLVNPDSVNLTIKTVPVYVNDSTYRNHTRYIINKIKISDNYINSDKKQNKIYEDTLGLEFIKNELGTVKKDAIRKSVSINNGDIYDYVAIEETYKNLSNLGVFAYINIEFEESGDSLNINIQLSPAQRNSISIEAKGTNTSGNLGISASLLFNNKNTFRGAEKLYIGMNAGSEVQNNSFIFDSLSNTLNTVEFGPEISLSFPSLFIPKNWASSFSNLKTSRTEFGVSYNFQERLEYTRHLTLFDYSYIFSIKDHSRHDLSIVELSTSKFDEESPIVIFADTTGNEYYQNSFRSYLNLGNHYSYTVNHKNSFFKTDIQIAGNILSLFNQSSLISTNSDNQYIIFGIPYSQFLRTFFDYRRSKSFNNKDQIAAKTELGVAIPLGNSRALPFDKSFFSGGSNSLRAFRNRTVGPGSYYQNPDSLLTQIGDIKLEFNLEYRFDLNSWIEGAVFADAGNIWLFNEDEENKPGAHFEFNRFYKELATGTGIGLRMDLTFFLFRLDWSLPIHTPAIIPEYAKEVINNKFNNRISRSQLSIGIGYPF